MSTHINERLSFVGSSVARVDRVVQLISWPHCGAESFVAAAAQFGAEFDTDFFAQLALADPFKACSPLQNSREVVGKIVVARRGSCMFEEKARFAQNAGALGILVIDNQKGTSASATPWFAMSSGNNREDGEKVQIPCAFLFHKEGQKLLDNLFTDPDLVVRLGKLPLNSAICFKHFLLRNPTFMRHRFPIENQFLAIDAEKKTLRVNFIFGAVDEFAPPEQRQVVVERNIEWIGSTIHFPMGSNSAIGEAKRIFSFLGHTRTLAYSLLGFEHKMRREELTELRQLVQYLRLRQNSGGEGMEKGYPLPFLGKLDGSSAEIRTRSVICYFRGLSSNYVCSTIP